MMRSAEFAGEKKRIVILGGGFGGAYAAKTLLKEMDPGEIEVTVIDRNNYLLFYPLLVEAGVGAIEARHVVVPIRRFMPRGDFRMAEVLDVDTAEQQVQIQVIGKKHPEILHYDHLVFGLGSITRIPPIPGLKEFGFELKTLVDAIELRDRSIRLLELANTISDPARRRELLTIVVIGANYTGVELAGEYHALLREEAKAYPNVVEADVRMVVLEYADRILPSTSERLADWSLKTLTKRGVDIRTKTTVSEIGADYALATDGERIPTRTVVWAAGVAPSPLVRTVGNLPLNERGYIDCEQTLRVKGFENVWAIGDTAFVLDDAGRPYAPTAQNASRQGPHVARNILAAIHGEELTPFRFKVLGSFAAIGCRQAAANVFGKDVTGFLGWILYRGAYLVKMPTLAMKARVLGDWIRDLIFGNEPVQLGLHRTENDPAPAPPADGLAAIRASADEAQVG